MVLRLGQCVTHITWIIYIVIHIQRMWYYIVDYLCWSNDDHQYVTAVGLEPTTIRLKVYSSTD